MKNLLIVDGNSILNRSFYGVQPLSNKNGLPTNAVFGMIKTIKHHLDALKPEYAVMAFDLRAKTFRHKACDFYKANRKPMPEDLAVQLPYAKRCMEYMGFNILELEGYEADDIIGTVSKMSDDFDDIHSYVLTGDRDSLQLIDEKSSVILVKNKGDVVYDTQTFIAEYGVTPMQYIDVKSIMGDTSDNIPGISGIGEKGAFKLISEFGSLDGLYEKYRSSSLSENMKAKIEAGHDMAYTSKFLATIVCDAPIQKSVPDFIYRGFDEKNLALLFRELDFEKLAQRLNISLDTQQTPNVNSAKMSVPVSINSVGDIKGETIAVYFDNDKAYVCNSKYNFICKGNDCDLLLSANKVICHDAKSLLKAKKADCVFDVMLAAYVLSPSDSSYSVDELCKKYLGTGFSAEYGAQLIFELYRILSDKLVESKLYEVFEKIELPLAAVLADMEAKGFRIDTDGLKKYSEYLLFVADSNKQRIYMLAGEEFNINSPKQLGDILFEKMGLRHGKKTKTGYSTSAEILEELAPESEIISEVLEYRQVMKLNSTYCDGLLKVADDIGRVHTTFNQTVTVTGRLSSAEPNLQNIPIRTPLGRNMRKYFITKGSDYVLIDADYSQIELKVLAHMSKDANMIHAFKSGADIHRITASQVFGIPFDMVTDEMRKRAKAVNFGIVYGIGDFSLAKDLHISKREAKEYINSYFDTYPDVHAFIKSLVDEARKKGYAETMFGRKRFIPELSSTNKITQAFGERVAMNSPIQGTAADIIKIAMVNVNRALSEAGIDASLILQVHDELIIESHVSCAEKAAEILKHEMENAVSLSVPLTADVGIGANWYDAK